jgi:hypothetical protein
MVRNISTDDYSNDLSNDEQLSLKELQDSGKSIQFIKRITAISTLFAWDTAQGVGIRMLVSKPVDNFHIIFTQDL